MKTTIDLPEALVREMKLRAVRERRKLKDVAAEVFKAGLLSPRLGSQPKPYRQKLESPLFACEASKASAPSMSVSDLLKMEQSAQAEEDAKRASSAL